MLNPPAPMFAGLVSQSGNLISAPRTVFIIGRYLERLLASRASPDSMVGACLNLLPLNQLSVMSPRMALHVANALALIAERASGRAEPPVAAILAIFFASRDQRRRRKGYRARTTRDSGHGCDHAVGGRIDYSELVEERCIGPSPIGRDPYWTKCVASGESVYHRVGGRVDYRGAFAAEIHDISAGAVWRDSYIKGRAANIHPRDHVIGGRVQDGDASGIAVRDISAGAVGRDCYSSDIADSPKAIDDGIGGRVNDSNIAGNLIPDINSSAIGRDSYIIGEAAGRDRSDLSSGRRVNDKEAAKVEVSDI